MDAELESKTHRLVRMVFQDVYANFYSRPDTWRITPPSAVIVNGWRINLGESNAGTLQVICAAIETFGRALFGYTVERDVSGKTFAGFIDAYFSQEYRGRGAEIYSCFRCGLLHSHYLGFGSASGFFPSRNGRTLGENHLQYADLAGKTATVAKDALHFRLILNINIFTADFQRAVELFIDDVKNGRTKTVGDQALDLLANLRTSLKDFPLERPELFKLPGLPTDLQDYGSSSLAGTTTTDLPPA